MPVEKVLEKAIEKAEKHGYTLSLAGAKILDHGGYRAIIFSHDFAKAFFGIDGIETQSGIVTAAWIVHLHQMVLEEEPLKYLEIYL